MLRWRFVGCWSISSGTTDGSTLRLCKGGRSPGARASPLVPRMQHALPMQTWIAYVKLAGCRALERRLWYHRWQPTPPMQSWRVSRSWSISSGTTDGSRFHLCQGGGLSCAGVSPMVPRMEVRPTYVKVDGHRVLEYLLRHSAWQYDTPMPRWRVVGC